MRVLVAPDKFAGTLTAAEAARAIATGWAERAPDDKLTLAPMADGGTGFVDVLHEALGGEVCMLTVRGPLGGPTPATILLTGGEAYVEASQACGLHLVEGTNQEGQSATSFGVGEAVAAAAEAGATRVVVGLGDSVTNDAGAGMLAALGATADVPLDQGPAGLGGVTSVDVTPVRERLAGVEVVVACDVETTLLGMFGTTNTFGADRGLDDGARQRVDAILDAFVVAACGAAPADRRVADLPGAGAAGGLGFALMLLGAEHRSGIGLVAEKVGLLALARDHDVVLTGEGAYDFSSRAGKVVYGVAEVAAGAVRPCVVLAGQVLVGSREMRAMGVEAAYAVADLVGEQAAEADPRRSLADLAARVARTWSF